MNPEVVVDRVDHLEDLSTNDTETRKTFSNNVPLLQSNMSYLNIEGAPTMKQRKISDFISDMVQSDDEATTTFNKRTEKLADKLNPKMMVKTASHETKLYHGRDSNVSQLSHVLDQSCHIGGRNRLGSNFGE